MIGDKNSISLSSGSFQLQRSRFVSWFLFTALRGYCTAALRDPCFECRTNNTDQQRNDFVDSGHML